MAFHFLQRLSDFPQWRSDFPQWLSTFPRNPRKSIYGKKYTKDHYLSFVFFATCSPACSPSFVIPATIPNTCNTACKTRRLLCKAIRTVAIEKGLREELINVMEDVCWNHLRNVWFGTVNKELSSHLDEVLQDNLSEIHPIL